MTPCGAEVGNWGLWALQQFSFLLSFYKLKKKLFLAVLSFCCCTGFSPVAMCGLLLLLSLGSRVPQASVLAACGLRRGSWAPEHRLNSRGAEAQLLHGMGDLQGPGIKPVSPALAGRYFNTEPLGKPNSVLFFNLLFFSVSSLIEK